MTSLVHQYRVLGLPASACQREVTAAFRRLAKEHHPDLNPGRDSRRRFVEIVEAYRQLQQRSRASASEARWGRCPRCGRYGGLLDALDGGESCADCLLGQTYRSRFLPLPLVVVAKHLCVFVLYAACVLSMFFYLNTGDAHYVLTSLLSVATGMLFLAVQVLSLTASITPARPVRPGRA